MILLAIDWGVVGIKVGQLLLSLSILVILHEFGHYITARWFGCRVERFFLFFDPWFALFKKKVGETVYGIGWLPLGGYVKISGMIDESMDKDQLALPPQPWEFRSKPAWQRLIIMIGGVTVNILLAFIIYSGILMVWGERTVPNQSVKYGIAIQDSVMYELGFKDGDKILAANKEPINDFSEVTLKVLLSETVTLERDGKVQEMVLPVNLIGELVEKRRGNANLLTPRMPVKVMEVSDTMAGAKAGLKVGDQIVAVNGKSTFFYDELRRELQQHKNDSVTIGIKRGQADMTLQAKLDAEGRLGFFPVSSADELQKMGVLSYSVKKYGVLEAIPGGVKLAIKKLNDYIGQFKKILSPETGAYKGVGGFKSMGNIFPAKWDWESFWTITAFFSIILAFMNLLPIPALDGGHVLFTLVEMITGRKPNQKFLEYAQVAGMIILLGLMVYANANDWLGWGRGK
ncbi:MAG: RIP metalloprotease RseP [Chitinophagaceae bacterium]|nr:RIP metalloprotease RseP [Chitinophagaceae bacterium]